MIVLIGRIQYDRFNSFYKNVFKSTYNYEVDKVITNDSEEVF